MRESSQLTLILLSLPYPIVWYILFSKVGVETGIFEITRTFRLVTDVSAL